MLSNLIRQSQLVETFGLRATVPHRVLHDRIGCNPTEARAKNVTQVIDWKIRNTGFLEGRLPSSPNVSDGLLRIGWTGEQKGTSRSTFLLPFNEYIGG